MNNVFDTPSSDLGPPHFHARADGLRLAHRHWAPTARRPTIVFLPGYRSDMRGQKATALHQWAMACGNGLLLLDYSGCGESDGAFVDGTLDQWRDDALALIDAVTHGPLIIVGSSMGGWLALLVALARPDRVTGLVTVAAAPDFTAWSYGDDAIAIMRRDGQHVVPGVYGDEPHVTTLAFWESGQALRLLDGGAIPVRCPVHLLHGQQDDSVPWELALDIAAALDADRVTITLIKDGDHRLSRPSDIALLLHAIDCLVEH